MRESQGVDRDALRGAVADRGALRQAAARSGKNRWPGGPIQFDTDRWSGRSSATVALFIIIVELKFELTTVTDTVTVTDTGGEEAQGGGR